MRREVKIGVFAVVMLGCLWGGIRFLSGIDIFSRNIPYYVAYPEISGIQTATPVTIQGVKVGTVTAIGFDPSVSRDVVLQLTVRRSLSAISRVMLSRRIVCNESPPAVSARSESIEARTVRSSRL